MTMILAANFSKTN